MIPAMSCKETEVLYLLLKTGKYAGTRAFEGSITWTDPGKDRNAPGGELWLGSVGTADPDQVFYDRPVRAIKFKIPAQDALGQDEGRGFL